MTRANVLREEIHRLRSLCNWETRRRPTVDILFVIVDDDYVMFVTEDLHKL